MRIKINSNKRSTQAYHIYAEYDEILQKIQFSRDVIITKKGQVIEYLIDQYINNLSDADFEKLMNVKIKK